MVFEKRLLVVCLLAAALLSSGCVTPPGNGDGNGVNGNGNGNGGNGVEQHFCSPESRLAEACALVYQPVCGWSDPEKIQCFAFPCADNYSNSCLACLNENVLYWTEGNCPK